ncbi:MAG: fibronectin type III domain-containing protein [Pseudonocardiales bacterium]
MIPPRTAARKHGRPLTAPFRAPFARRILAGLLGASVIVSGAVVASVIAAPSAHAAAETDSPTGRVEVLKVVPGGVAISGWTFDPNSITTAVTVYLWIDGKLSGIRADRYRPDVAATFPGVGPNHGFATTRLLPEGSHRICVVAGNIGAGANKTLACATLTVADTPRGRVDSLAAVPGGLTIAGWTFDPNAPRTALHVYLYIDTKLSGILADKPRADVGAAYPAAGPNHGFATTIRLPEGQHHVCAVTANISYGRNRTLLCSAVTVIDSPRGRVERLAQAPGGITVAGWTFDPDAPRTALHVYLYIDTKLSGILADRPRADVGAAYPAAGPYHGFATTIRLPEGQHRICVVAGNVSYGSSRTMACRTLTLRYTPTTVLSTVSQTATGVRVSGWSTDPDTASAILVRVSADGRQLAQLTADDGGGTHPGHNFTVFLTLKSGSHSICAVGVNVAFGTGTGPAACRSVTLQLNPFGRFESVSRAADSVKLIVRGWAIDPDTSSPIKVAIRVDAAAPILATAGATRSDVALVYPRYGTLHGYAVTVAASDGEHTVCVSAINVSGGTGNVLLGCRIINAVHPVVPTAPRSVRAIAGYSGASVSWIKPASDGGAPVSRYTVTASPGGTTVSVSGRLTSATVAGLAAHTSYTFAVVAVNVVGRSAAGKSAAVTTLTGTPPQTTPAPISTSRYIRNIRGSSSTELAMMRAEGAADAKANPAGHRYLILLDIGGQDQADGGVVLSATVRFVSYSDLVRDLNAYVDGYHSAQHLYAPVTIAIGTNNDMDVSSSSGASWARTVVNPVVAHAATYAGMKIAGANDIEPGFRATYTQTKAWLSGYLGATSAAFVFNGSADGCAWTVTNAGCNNGWSMAGLYYLAAGNAPTRIVNLPQIYNNTMAAQWKYISLTGVAQSRPRINFGGALTEWTACAQAGGCGSLTGANAWTQMWNQLQSHVALKVPSLPYSTDLRIDS